MAANEQQVTIARLTAPAPVYYVRPALVACKYVRNAAPCWKPSAATAATLVRGNLNYQLLRRTISNAWTRTKTIHGLAVTARLHRPLWFFTLTHVIHSQSSDQYQFYWMSGDTITIRTQTRPECEQPEKDIQSTHFCGERQAKKPHAAASFSLGPARPTPPCRPWPCPRR